MALLQYAPFSSALDAGFWHTLSQNKLNVYGLDDTEVPLHGFYYNGNADGIPCSLNLDYNAFNEQATIPPKNFPAHGSLFNTNTIDAFRDSDKKKLLETAGNKIWADIISGKALDDPSLLTRFHLLTFADLKKYHFYYWFAFPALSHDVTMVKEPVTIDERFTEQQIASFQSSLDTYSQTTSPNFFIATEQGNTLEVHTLASIKELASKQKVILCFADPCTLKSHPGWPLRNLLALIATLGLDTLTELDVMSYRDKVKDGKRSISHSIIFTVNIPHLDSSAVCPKCVGWEKNERQKLGPRIVNLSSSMDATRLAESSVDLNLKLMRWRLLPDLDLDKVAKTKCLLLGSGTLGCNIARGLMGWGVRNITLVDYGKISYSNPVRQSLFEFGDSLQGGKPKAETAAEAMKRIFPGVNAQGVSLSIPMPGHSVAKNDMEAVRKDVETLDALIDQHDVVFLLMDTRESRWLPTLLGACKRKIVINAALGFDTFLVLRHGLKPPPNEMESESEASAIPMTSNIPGSQLGCYFCNDVVAPGNSTKDRTLDQQCTVSRPGMSMLTSALAVELLISILQHPDGGNAPSDTSAKDEHLTQDHASPLGIIPHQIRGFLSRFHTVLAACRAFSQCTACSPKVMEMYEKEGFNFLLNAFNETGYLEEITGLKELHDETILDEVWEMSDDESISSI
ncbi:unnamed protein product [Owenia fusiformis]|uniref:Ubiquitin-like modifier-activating enzyme ATG7 n=1 Tax=Owenia fusiformis TaxID=6347 RepID=A0A8J1Y690_OWEFU|nr:unnamed protein product [Owenia fusiformis]